MLFESLAICAFILIVIYAIINAIKDLKTIELNAQYLARQRQPKQKRFEFIEEDETDNILLASDDEEFCENIFWEEDN